MQSQNVLVGVALGLVGLAGMLFWKRFLAMTASLTLLGMLIWGKAAGSILKLDTPDTAVLLTEFALIILLAEESLVVLTFHREHSNLKSRRDEYSQLLTQRLQGWLANQLSNQAKLALAGLGLSIGLVPIAGLTTISSDQLVFSATLALLAVVVLMFLVTHRREPESN